ncbi:hypothetical protein [Methylohalobius crimeensis]|uniref:hypothetical protein n=1 Tax=Methylohalobius crimeensis TaxID=244365 RepID=UPI0003B582D1|nr:hypothetical protein [Methylohalobius crimeensis]
MKAFGGFGLGLALGAADAIADSIAEREEEKLIALEERQRRRQIEKERQQRQAERQSQRELAIEQNDLKIKNTELWFENYLLKNKVKELEEKERQLKAATTILDNIIEEIGEEKVLQIVENAKRKILSQTSISTTSSTGPKN